MTERPARRWRLVRAERDGVATTARRLGRSLTRRRAAAPRRVWWLAAVVVLLLAALSWLVYGTSVLGVREVRVTGTELLSVGQVRAAAAVIPGTPLARVDTDEVARRVRALAPVAEVTVHRSWPSTVVIDVRERVPVAVVRAGGGYDVVDVNGVVFNRVDTAPRGLTLLKITASDVGATTRAAATVVAALPPTLRASVRDVAATSPFHLTLELADGRTVFWGDATRNDEKVVITEKLLAKADHRIDVSAPEMVAVQ